MMDKGPAGSLCILRKASLLRDPRASILEPVAGFRPGCREILSLTQCLSLHPVAWHPQTRVCTLGKDLKQQDVGEQQKTTAPGLSELQVKVSALHWRAQQCCRLGGAGTWPSQAASCSTGARWHQSAMWPDAGPRARVGAQNSHGDVRTWEESGCRTHEAPSRGAQKHSEKLPEKTASKSHCGARGRARGMFFILKLFYFRIFKIFLFL